MKSDPNTSEYSLPSRAGELERAGASAAVTAELGKRYAFYHEDVRSKLAEFGKRPDPSDYETLDDYLGACQQVHALIATEARLRSARAHIKTGRPLDAPLDTTVPLIDANDQIVSVE